MDRSATSLMAELVSDSVPTEAAIRQAFRDADREAQQGNLVVHVRNGVPLTEHGAKLLGVTWNGNPHE